MKKVVLILFLIGIFSCESNKKTTDLDEVLAEDSVVYEKVVVYNLRLHYIDSIEDTIIKGDTFFIDSMFFVNQNHLCFKQEIENDSICYGPFFYVIDSMSWGYNVDNELFPLANIDTFILSYNEIKIEVVKSHYDLKNTYDEESYVYWNNEIGILAEDNFSLDMVAIYDYEKYKGLSRELLLDELIQRRNTQDSIRYEEVKGNLKNLDSIPTEIEYSETDLEI